MIQGAGPEFIVMIVDAERPQRSRLVATLWISGLNVVEAGSGEEALVLAGVQPPDIYVIDLSLPGMDGFALLGHVRAHSSVPVVVLTFRDSKYDKIAALDAGADDYVIKSIDDDELIARLRAAIRRQPRSPPEALVVRAGDVEFNRGRGEVSVGGRRVHLTSTELALLELLVSAPGGLVTYASVATTVRSRKGSVDRRSVRSLVAQLRRKLGDDASDPRLIVTHIGLGYRWIGSEV